MSDGTCGLSSTRHFRVLLVSIKEEEDWLMHTIRRPLSYLPVLYIVATAVQKYFFTRDRFASSYL